VQNLPVDEHRGARTGIVDARGPVGALRSISVIRTWQTAKQGSESGVSRVIDVVVCPWCGQSSNRTSGTARRLPIVLNVSGRRLKWRGWSRARDARLDDVPLILLICWGQFLEPPYATLAQGNGSKLAERRDGAL
jgi:hypothetical protein